MISPVNYGRSPAERVSPPEDVTAAAALACAIIPRSVAYTLSLVSLVRRLRRRGRSPALWGGVRGHDRHAAQGDIVHCRVVLTPPALGGGLSNKGNRAMGYAWDDCGRKSELKITRVVGFSAQVPFHCVLFWKVSTDSC